ncbi:Pimeloyl-ACP methyl ester carboxylesterase [Pseudomonas cuatrocienegasensis]|uniref:Pimeloyl-ACP methyl ester carboxylesterase n=1 Tax=Pseudomonas cuatrocienegasensis TaxID=543360 RepID=A0ABY1B963_9PSED|nr:MULTISPECIES: alpha/beta hydrolase [Pseudomonas]OEC35680.1 MFS transporter [Pseudomonas sp. 21C1]SEQ24987.1 Pimeloyl-ACP methyl ester carboxylesterase [Pseudomonas cuatrocienegasensis]
MKPAIAVVELHGKYKVYTEFYANPQAQKTIVLVNGSLSTTAAFAQTIKYLQPHFNVVLYDQPYAGQSKAHNDNSWPITKENEASILLGLIEHFQADQLMSFSWGGVAAMLALAKRPARIEKAVVCSFSPLLNEPMIDYLEEGLTYLNSAEGHALGDLVNSTIGKHLPSLFKRYNQRHIGSLDQHEYRQMHAHVHQVLHMDAHCQMECLAAIDIPVLFVNGEHDEYTSAQDVRVFASHLNDCHFVTINNAGHFLDMEHKGAWLQCKAALLGFLDTPARSHSAALYQHEQPLAMAI